MRHKIIILLFLSLILLVSISLSQKKEETESAFSKRNPEPVFIIKKSIYDSILSINYKVTEKMFIEVFIRNRRGDVIDFPISKEYDISEDSLFLKTTDCFTGSYFIGIEGKSLKKT